MYNYLLIVRGVNKDMTTFEFEELWRIYLGEEINLTRIKNTYYIFSSNYFIDSNHEIFSRITLTNYFAEIIFEGEEFKEFENTIMNYYDCSFLEGKSFAVLQDYKSKTPLFRAKDLAGPLWKSLEKPVVDLENPDVSFLAVSIDKTLYFCRVIFENQKQYLERMPKVRPVAMPYTLKSDMARVGINYLGLRRGKILDPFCGIGGILLEAYDMGFEIYGNDISWNDIQYLKKNFAHYFPQANPHLSICDAREQFLQDNSVEGVITDIPYGRSSRRLGLDLYEKFLINTSAMLKENGRLVVIYANFVEFRDIALNHFEEIKQIDQYINKSMTRHILVLKNTKKSLNKN